MVDPLPTVVKRDRGTCDWAVEPTGLVVLRSGEEVVFENGVELGGSVAVEIDTGLLPP